MQHASDLDLNLAWIRVKNDLREQIFVKYPYAVELIDYKQKEWLGNLMNDITTNHFSPSMCQVVDIPKPGYHIRPGAVLTMEDTVVYSATVLKILPEISDRIRWSEKKYRFSNILSRQVFDPRWAEFPIASWKAFYRIALTRAKEFPFAVKFDIASFFEDIEIKRLTEDLVEMKCEKNLVDFLSRCLNHWSGSRRRGIPQGYLPSNILSEVYLNSIDLALLNSNSTYVRYVDDGYLFAKSKEKAVDALRFFTRKLRVKGLNLQSAKTKILSRKDAIKDIEEVENALQKAKKAVLKNAFETAGIIWSYLSPADIGEIFGDQESSPPIIAIRRAFDKEIRPNPETFNKSLFHFILGRLAVNKDDYAFNFCLDLLGVRPEETVYILRYIKVFKLGHRKEISDRIAKELSVIHSEKLDFSRFKLIQWLFEEDLVNDNLVSIVRENFGMRDLSDWTRAYILAYLGKFGNSADLDMLEDQYSKESNPYAKATIICSLRGLPSSRRNDIYSRAKTDHSFVEMAVDWSKSHPLQF